MKKLILLCYLGMSISAYSTFDFNFFDLHHKLNRCSANNSYCSACSDCSKCKNCAQNGGTCAVCYIPRRVTKKKHLTTKPQSQEPSIPTEQQQQARTVAKKISTSLIYPKSTPKSTQRTAFEPIRSLNQYSHEVPTDSNYNSSLTSTSPEMSKLDPESKDFSYTVEIPDKAKFVMVTAAIANLRAAATTKTKILQKLVYGDLLIKVKTSDGWIRVQTLDSGKLGYVRAGVVK